MRRSRGCSGAIIGTPTLPRVCTALTLFLACAGLALLPEFPWLGIGCFAGAYGLHRVAARDEDAFMGLVLVLAGAGGLAVTLDYLAGLIAH